jgi:two-component system OmpR family sensor kinase
MTATAKAAAKETAETESRARDASVPRRRLIGLRGRLLWVAVFLLAASTAVSLFAQTRLLISQERADTRAALHREAGEFERVARGRNPETGRPWGADVRGMFEAYLRRNVSSAERVIVALTDGQVYRAAGELDDAVLADADLIGRWTESRAPEQGRAQTPKGTLEWLTVPVVHGQTLLGTFVVAEFTAAREERVEENIRRSALVSALVLLLAVVGAWFAMGRGLRPLRAVSAAAREIEETDLSRRIPASGRDEMADLARTFNGMLDRLERAFSTQRHLVSDAGHELRTPITVIRGHLEVMGTDPEDVDSTVTLVIDELARMNRMVEDLLMLARLESPDFLIPEPVTVTTMLEETFDKASALGRRRWTLDSGATGTAHLDRQKIQQALMQLAKNAVQYTPEDTLVQIGSRDAGDDIELWVLDEGPGVPADERERIFDRFARGRGARRHHEGAGLGLSIVAGIAAAHGGGVRVEAPSAGGARFVITVPRGR